MKSGNRICEGHGEAIPPSHLRQQNEGGLQNQFFHEADLQFYCEISNWPTHTTSGSMGRDGATEADIQLRDFKDKWPHYIRADHPEFVAGTMANGVSLKELMETLEMNAFSITQENARQGVGNTDPRRAYMQQAAVRPSREDLAWLHVKLEAALSKHGRVPQVELDELDWPELPPFPKDE